MGGDPPPVQFGEAIVSRKPSCGNGDMAHKTACIMHFMNIAIRTGRKIKIDPEKQIVLGDEEANRIAHQPMRGPWHL